ncbi:hypothetical protein M8C21_015731 [Ambrosia artemisiifolia]|uniref:Uncharacterized protein n=1 Tax=Ambrosia artemisiifolia TaxID=4212 RepID=A0AAD5D395_AMBAR|nr:hypothetical protein M8C21_015731 [Ambrosia artemisiifolia]
MAVGFRLASDCIVCFRDLMMVDGEQRLLVVIQVTVSGGGDRREQPLLYRWWLFVWGLLWWFQ